MNSLDHVIDTTPPEPVDGTTTLTAHPKQWTRTSIEPIAVGVDQAAALIGVSRSMFYELLDAGKIGPMGVKFSAKCHRFPLAELREWAAAGMPSREAWQRMRGSTSKIGNNKGS